MTAKSILLFLVAFVVTYIGSALLLATITHLVGNQPSSTNVFAILIALLVTTITFARRHQRTFTRKEYFWMLGGSIVADVAIQVGFSIPLLGIEVLSLTYLGSLSFVVVLHAALFAVGYSSFAMKHYVPDTDS